MRNRDNPWICPGASLRRDAKLSDSPAHPSVLGFSSSIVLCAGFQVVGKGGHILQSSAHLISVFIL